MKILKKYMKDVNTWLETSSEFNKEKMKEYGLTVEELMLKEEDTGYPFIKNYYRFYLGGPGLNLYSLDLCDFDCYPGVIEQIEKDYENITFNGDRYFILDEMKYYFETDTAYSFKRIFHDFLRENYPDFFRGYLEEYHLEDPTTISMTKELRKKYEIYKSIYLLRHMDQFVFKEEHRELLNLFNEFAKWYHTYNNVILVPYGYNTGRNQLYKDIYSVSMQKLIDVEGYDPKLIEKYSRYHKNEDWYRFDEQVMAKLNPEAGEDRLSLDEYQKYLEEALHFIQNKDQ